MLLGVTLTQYSVAVFINGTYSMGPAGAFTSGKVSYVNTDDIQTHLVTSSDKTLRFYNKSAGVYDNGTAYNVDMDESIPQMRYRWDGTWLAARGESSTKIYFMRQISGKYTVDHIVDVGSYPNSIGWAFDQNTLAAGLANGNIVLLQFDTATNKFKLNQSIATNHTNGVSKVFGTTSRIYSTGSDASDNNVNIYWLNTTTGKWSYNWTVPNVGTNSDTPTAMHISGSENRVAVGQSNGDIYILSHPDQNYEWYISKIIFAAFAHLSFPINFVRLTSNGWYLITSANKPSGEVYFWAKKYDWG
jgi:hypothetical protein